MICINVVNNYSVFKLSIGLVLAAKSVCTLTVMQETIPTITSGIKKCAKELSARSTDAFNHSSDAVLASENFLSICFA